MRILLAIIFLLLVVDVFAEICRPKIKGKTYDFTKVSRPGNDYTIHLTQNGVTSLFWINLCTPISRDCNGPTNLAGCQRWNDPTYQFGSALGSAGDTIWKSGDSSLGVENVIAYNQGSAQNQQIQLVCDRNNQAALVSISPKDVDNTWTFVINTTYACTKSDSDNGRSGGHIAGWTIFLAAHISLMALSIVLWIGTERRLHEWEAYERVVKPNTVKEAIPPEMSQVAFSALSQHDVEDIKWLGISCVNILAARIALGILIIMGPVSGSIAAIVALAMGLPLSSIAPIFFVVFCLAVGFILILHSRNGGRKFKPEVYALTSTHAIIITTINSLGMGSTEVNRYPLNSADPKMVSPDIRKYPDDKGSIIFSQTKKWVEEVQHQNGRAHKEMVHKTIDIGFHNIPRFAACHNLFVELQAVATGNNKNNVTSPIIQTTQELQLVNEVVEKEIPAKEIHFVATTDEQLKKFRQVTVKKPTVEAVKEAVAAKFNKTLSSIEALYLVTANDRLVEIESDEQVANFNEETSVFAETDETSLR